MKAEGAVFIAKTNIPQSMLAAEAHNNVFGQTKNPVVSHLNPGGSSGGEGSVLAFNGSALGIGTDVAGSIRYVVAEAYILCQDISSRLENVTNDTVMEQMSLRS